MITVRFPSLLHALVNPEVTLPAAPPDVAALLAALDQQFPGLARELDDPLYNFAVNDEMLLHGVRAHKLTDGDVVEVVPTISGGSRRQGGANADVEFADRVTPVDRDCCSSRQQDPRVDARPGTLPPRCS